MNGDCPASACWAVNFYMEMFWYCQWHMALKYNPCNPNNGLTQPHSPMPTLHSGIGLQAPPLQDEVLPSGEAHRLFHLSIPNFPERLAPDRPSNSNRTAPVYQYKTITGAGPKTIKIHWTSITLDLTGLWLKASVQNPVCSPGIGFWFYRSL